MYLINKWYCYELENTFGEIKPSIKIAQCELFLIL